MARKAESTRGSPYVAAPATNRERRRAVKLELARTPRPLERRYRQMIRSFDLWTVLKISILFWSCAMLVFLLGLIVLWWIGSAFGVIDGVEDFIAELFGYDTFELLSWRILRGATLVALVMTCLLVVGTMVATALYNLFAEFLGGVEVVVTEEEPEL